MAKPKKVPNKTTAKCETRIAGRVLKFKLEVNFDNIEFANFDDAKEAINAEVMELIMYGVKDKVTNLSELMKAYKRYEKAVAL